MQELARKFAAELSFDFGGVVGEVAAPRPTPLSVLREVVADNCGFAHRGARRSFKTSETTTSDGKPPVNLLAWFAPYPALRNRYRRGRPMVVVHAAEIRVLGATAIEDYHAHLMRLDRASLIPGDDRGIDAHCLDLDGVGRDPDRRLCEGRDARERRDRAGPHGAARRGRDHASRTAITSAASSAS